MATYTSQTLIGQKHTYDGGILSITHSLFLSENSIPAWVLEPADEEECEKQAGERITWHPTVENMLEDAMVMIGLYVLKDEVLTALARKYFKHPESRRILVYEDIAPEGLRMMYERARKIESGHKIVLTVLRGTSLLRQLPILKNYQYDIEVCASVYVKEFSPWSRQFEESGVLEEEGLRF